MYLYSLRGFVWRDLRFYTFAQSVKSLALLLFCILCLLLPLPRVDSLRLLGVCVRSCYVQCSGRCNGSV